MHAICGRRWVQSCFLKHGRVWWHQFFVHVSSFTPAQADKGWHPQHCEQFLGRARRSWTVSWSHVRVVVVVVQDPPPHRLIPPLSHDGIMWSRDGLSHDMIVVTWHDSRGRSAFTLTKRTCSFAALRKEKAIWTQDLRCLTPLVVSHRPSDVFHNL